MTVDTLLNWKSEGKNPKLAAAFSAVVPGLGQAYNKKYWKIPIVYAGFGALGYLFNTYEKEYMRYRVAYTARTDDNPLSIDEFFYTSATASDLKAYRDGARRNRDLTFIGAIALYVLNIVDATVDAHLYDWDTDDDLTLRMTPMFMESPGGMQGYVGVECKIKF